MAFYRMGGGGDEPTGNASEEHVLASKTFSNDLGTGKTGTMPDNTSTFKDVELSPDRNTVVIPRGYHPGNKTVFFTTNEVTELTADRTKSVTYTYKDFDVRGMKPISKITIDPIRLSGTPYVPNKRSSSIDMYSDKGATGSPITDSRECYRYIDTSKVPNTHSGTYTIPSNNKDSIITLANNHTYLKIDPSDFYWSAFSDGTINFRDSMQMEFARSFNRPGLGSNDYTCNWNGALLVVQIHYDNEAVMTPVEIEALNSEANYAQPRAAEMHGSTIVYVLNPIKFKIHNNSSDDNKGQLWLHWLYNIRRGASFRITQYGAESNAATVINLYKVFGDDVDTFFG